MPDNNEAELISFPHYVMTTFFQPGDSRTHLIEELLAGLWASVDHAHVFRVEFNEESASWEGFWIVAPRSFWDRFIKDVREENTAAVTDMLAGLEEMLAEQPDSDA